MIMTMLVWMLYATFRINFVIFQAAKLLPSEVVVLPEKKTFTIYLRRLKL